MSKLLPPTDPHITTRDERINSHVRIRIYHPPEPAAFLPVILFAHGGGFTAGNLDTEDHLCRILCAESDSIVISVEYRTGPTITLPAPIDDFHAAYLWTLENAESLDADPHSIVLLGGSAGGALALALVHRLLRSPSDRPSIRPAGLALMQPMSLHPSACPPEYADLHTSYTELSAPDLPVVHVGAALAAFERCSGAAGYKLPALFPQAAGAAGVKDFPPTYIFNTDLECFRDDGAVLEAECKDAGVPVCREVMAGLPHYFWSFPLKTAGRQFRDRLVDGIQWVLNTADLASGLQNRHV